MATLLHSESRRLYSWWWDSHNSPKNSKWLQDNLTDMDAKVKQMIKLINEDADSFARRAEMYYKKRPELMKLVEEFYRAYRALAERYDHATVELRQAHRTMAEAFPNQLPFMLADDSPSSEPHTPKTPRPIRALLDQVDLYKDALQAVRKKGNNTEEYDSLTSKKGLKRFCDMLESGEAVPQSPKFSDGDQNFKTLKKHDEETETEVQTLKDSLAKIQAEKDAVLGQYNQALEKLSELEAELNGAQSNAGRLDEQAFRGEIEISVLKETLEKFKAERDADLLRYNQCMERICSLENIISKGQEDGKALNERATRAEVEAQCLKEELSKLEAEKEAILLQFKQSLDKISSLEDKISLAESHVRILNCQIERAETEVTALKQAVTGLTEEKEATALRYQKCLETIAELEDEISHVHEEAKKLENKIHTEAAKLKNAEEQCVSLEKSNLSLQAEAEKLAVQIAIKDQELLKKQGELEKLQALLQDDQLRFVQVEATLQTMQYMHSQSQEEQRALAQELKSELQRLKELEICKNSLEEEIQQVKGENQSLSEQNRSYNNSVDNLQNEICGLKVMKEKLEQEFEAQMEHTNALQDEVSSLKEEIKGLNKRYLALVLQVESVGLDPECLSSSVKELKDENLQLKEIYQKEREEKVIISEKLKSMDKIVEEKNVMEGSLSDLNSILQGSEEKIKQLQESCQFLQGEKANLVTEKIALLSQLQVMTENMKNLLEKNTVLENSLSESKIELEGLRAKSKDVEEFYQLLSDEKSSLLTERNNLVSQLENVEQRLENLERRFTTLEEKYAGLEMEKESTLCQVEQLQGSLSMEKEEHASYTQSTEARLTSLESHILLLQEENKLRKKDFEVELERAVNAQVEIFILQKFIRDLEERNMSLFIECQKHIEASKSSDKLISELEDENLEQQVEAEFLQDEIAKFRMGIQQVFMALQINPKTKHEDKIERQQVSLPYILNNIEELKSSLARNEVEKHELLVENSVLLTVIRRLKLENADFESEKRLLEDKLKVMTEEYLLLQKDKQELIEMNRKLQLDVSKGEQQEAALKSEVENLHVKLVSMQQCSVVLQEENCKALEENRSLLRKLSNLKEEERVFQEESSFIIEEAVALSNHSLVLEVIGTEKVAQLKAIAEDLDSIQMVNDKLKNELGELEERLKMKNTENLHLNDTVQKLDMQLHEITDLNGQLNVQIAVAEDFVKQKEVELLETQEKLRATQILNLELCRTVEGLKIQCEESKTIQEVLKKQIFELSNDKKKKTKEIAHLHQQNHNLECEVGMLQKEIEKHILREEHLCLELQEKSNEFELWDAEASTFYFDLQVSAVNEVILKNKLHELKGLCEDLKDESCSKSVEIEQLKGRTNSLESEIGGMKAQLSAYIPVVAALGDDVASLENNALNWTKLQLASGHGQGTEMAVQGGQCQEHLDNQSTIADGISDLQKMQTKIQAVGKAIADEMERSAKLDTSNTNLKLDVPREKTAELKRRGSSSRDAQREKDAANESIDNLKSRKTKPEIFDVRNGISMKDIPLDQASDCSFQSSNRRRHGRVDDQMLELWETAEQELMVDKPSKHASIPTWGNAPCRPKDARHKSRVPSIEFLVEKELGVDRLELSPSVRKSNKRKFLERLSSDAEKLTSLQTTVKDLRKKMDMLRRSKKTKDIEYETVRVHLQEVEEAVVQLAIVNDELTRDIQESRVSWDGRTSADLENTGNVLRKRVTEQARKGSEKIGQLQLEVQNIEYLLLKLEDEKKSKVKNGFAESRTGILLKDMIYSGKRSTRRRKKVRFCGCMRSSSKKE